MTENIIKRRKDISASEILRAYSQFSVYAQLSEGPVTYSTRIAFPA